MSQPVNLSRRGLVGALGGLAAAVPMLARAAGPGVVPAASAASAVPGDIVTPDGAIVHVLGGPLSGTTLALAADLAEVLDDGANLRIMPIVGKGSLQNVADLAQMHGIDIAIAQSDVLAYARQRHLYPGLASGVQYIAKLYDGELHVLAKRDVKSLADLAGKKVNCDVPGGGTAITAPLVFDSLNIAVEVTNFDQDVALDKLKRGEIAAACWVVGKPGKLFSGIAETDGLHLLPVPMSSDLLETYLPSRITHESYPALVAADAPVDTIAVGYVMACRASRPGADNYRRIALFVDAFFSHFGEFLHAPRHPKWREVALGADVPGWIRFPVAQEWLAKHAHPNVAVSAMSDVEKEKLFHELQRWHESAAGK